MHCVVYLLNSDSQNHTLQDLTPYTTYTVSVRSHSTLTTGPFGTSQDITTLEDGKFQGKKIALQVLEGCQIFNWLF